MLYTSTTLQAKDQYGVAIAAYPAEVVDVNGALIGTATDPADYANIWNANSTNKRAGKLFPHTAFVFKVVKTRTNSCCTYGVTPFGSGCTSGGSSTPALNPVEVVVDGVGGPTSGTNVFTLPVGWEGKRIHVFIEGLFLNPSMYTRTTGGFTLNGGRLWRNDGAGLEERIVVTEYL